MQKLAIATQEFVKIANIQRQEIIAKCVLRDTMETRLLELTQIV